MIKSILHEVQDVAGLERPPSRHELAEPVLAVVDAHVDAHQAHGPVQVVAEPLAQLVVVLLRPEINPESVHYTECAAPL